ncbi:MAG: ATP-binding protein [Steroidobacteraceae bacterium]
MSSVASPVTGAEFELRNAFAEFGDASVRLSGAFESLERRVAHLSAELAESRRARERLGARLAATLEGLPGGVFLLDGAGRIIESNASARELLGEDHLGQGFDGLLASQRVQAQALIGDIELRSGRFVSLARRPTDEGEVVLLSDVTEAHLMQSFLDRQQRLLTLGELAAGLAHQIRTPLAAALLYASQMALPDQDGAALARCAARTVERLRELDKLITEMLAFARGNANLEPVNVNALLEQAAQWLRPALGPGVRLTIGTEAPDLTVRGNAPSLVSAVLNLATNALQAGGPELNIELLARRTPQGAAEIRVSDDGPGIAPALRERVFEPFFTTRARGNGLGLAIVKSIVEAHRGHIRLDAGARRGACFVIELPTELTP